MNVVRKWGTDTAIITAITLIIGLVAQQWAGLDTPDSSFYFSLANFGSEVTDRAPVDSYYWTRLGVIAPTFALTQLFGPWIGYFIWRLLLLATIIIAIYVATRKSNATRSTSALLAATLATSTVILSYLGNPYVTATALAGIAIATTSALFTSKKAAITSGAALGWLAMINPYAALLAGSIWLAIAIQHHFACRPITKITQLVTKFALAASSALVTFSVFLLIGTQLFPGMNWFRTYIEWNAKLDYTDFSSETPIWLTDPSLLVPLAMLIVISIQWWRFRTRATQVALTITLTTLGVSLAFLPAMAGITLESTTYTPMLWIPVSIAFAITFAERITVPIWITPIAIGILIAAGFQAVDFNGYIAVLSAIITTTFLTATKNNKLLVAALILFLLAAQLISNSRDQIGLFYSSPFAWAYQENPIKLKLANSVKAQQWLVDNTEPNDQVLTYVDGNWIGGDRDLYVAAAMQFWGENRTGVDTTIRPEDLERISVTRPTVIALYGVNKTNLELYADSLPKELNLGPLTCTDFDWPTKSAGAILCLTHVSR